MVLRLRKIEPGNGRVTNPSIEVLYDETHIRGPFAGFRVLYRVRAGDGGGFAKADIEQ